MNRREIVYYDVSPFASVSAQAVTPPNIQAFSRVQKLFRENQRFRSIQTCEHNYTVLDGTHDSFAPDENIALWSGYQSLASRLLPAPIVLDVTFGGLQSSPGIAFYFDTQNNVYADMVRVIWFKDDDVLSDKTFEPDNVVYSYHNKVELFNRVRVEFLRLNMSKRYLKLEAVLFGIVRVFGDDSLESLTINEGLDPTGRTVNINSASFTINDTTLTGGSFKDPIPYIFMKRQPLYIKYSVLNRETKIPFGTYYIDKSKKYADRRYSVEAVDKIGVLDATDEFLGGMYSDMPAETVINQIVGAGSAGQPLFSVEIDAELRDMPVNGWLPIMRRREALAQVVLAIGAIIDATRTDAIKIRAAPKELSRVISKDKIYQSSSVEIEFPVTGVEVVEHNYTPGETSKELHKDTFTEEKLIKFSEPVSDLKITNGTIIESGVNHAKITGTGAGETVLSGRAYLDSQSSVIVKSELELEGTEERVEKIDRGYLINSGNSQEIAQRLYEYYRRRHTFDGDFLMNAKGIGDSLYSPEVIGDIVQIKNLFEESDDITGNIEKLTLHLGAANIKARGVVRGD